MSWRNYNSSRPKKHSRVREFWDKHKYKVMGVAAIGALAAAGGAQYAASNEVRRREHKGENMIHESSEAWNAVRNTCIPESYSILADEQVIVVKMPFSAECERGAKSRNPLNRSYVSTMDSRKRQMYGKLKVNTAVKKFLGVFSEPYRRGTKRNGWSIYYNCDLGSCPGMSENAPEKLSAGALDGVTSFTDAFRAFMDTYTVVQEDKIIRTWYDACQEVYKEEPYNESITKLFAEQTFLTRLAEAAPKNLLGTLMSAIMFTEMLVGFADSGPSPADVIAVLRLMLPSDDGTESSRKSIASEFNLIFLVAWYMCLQWPRGMTVEGELSNREVFCKEFKSLHAYCNPRGTLRHGSVEDAIIQQWNSLVYGTARYMRRIDPYYKDYYLNLRGYGTTPGIIDSCISRLQDVLSTSIMSPRRRSSQNKRRRSRSRKAPKRSRSRVRRVSTSRGRSRSSGNVTAVSSMLGFGSKIETAPEKRAHIWDTMEMEGSEEAVKAGFKMFVVSNTPAEKDPGFGSWLEAHQYVSENPWGELMRSLSQFRPMDLHVVEHRNHEDDDSHVIRDSGFFVVEGQEVAVAKLTAIAQIAPILRGQGILRPVMHSYGNEEPALALAEDFSKAVDYRLDGSTWKKRIGFTDTLPSIMRRVCGAPLPDPGSPDQSVSSHNVDTAFVCGKDMLRILRPHIPDIDRTYCILASKCTYEADTMKITLGGKDSNWVVAFIVGETRKRTKRYNSAALNSQIRGYLSTPTKFEEYGNSIIRFLADGSISGRDQDIGDIIGDKSFVSGVPLPAAMERFATKLEDNNAVRSAYTVAFR